MIRYVGSLVTLVVISVKVSLIFMQFDTDVQRLHQISQLFRGQGQNCHTENLPLTIACMWLDYRDSNPGIPNPGLFSQSRIPGLAML